MNIQTTSNPKVAAEYIAKQISKNLEAGKRVLWFTTGGSSIDVAVEVAKIISEIRKENKENLVVTMTDERYGPVGHKDSNWQQMLDLGFLLPQVRQMPILTGLSREETARNFDAKLEKEFKLAEYKIGMFGVGPDGHTAGIMPLSAAASATSFAYAYQAPNFERVTITPRAIEMLDEAVVYMQGENKWWVVKDLVESNKSISEQPAQILKKVPLLTIFTDYQKQ